MLPVSSTDGWFRVGRVEVTSTVLVVALGAIGLVLGAFLPGLVIWGAHLPELVIEGQVWRLVTWPWVDAISLWSVFSLFILWYFGSDLEAALGRVRMAWLYAGCWGALTLAYLGVGLAFGGSALVGLGLVQFLVMLLWIADNPRRPFFFGIPAWVIGAVLLAVQVLGLVAARAMGALLSLVLAMLIIAILARRLGLLTDYPWIPGRVPVRTRPSVPRAQARAQARRTADSARIDELLDKINAEGIHSLSKAERRELDALRQRRRG